MNWLVIILRITTEIMKNSCKFYLMILHVFKICSLHLRITSTTDEFIWGPAGNGQFTIKCASFLQTQNIHAHSKSKLLMQMSFLPMPPKVKIFSWQLITKRIRTRDQVYTNELIDISCPFCNSEAKKYGPFIHELFSN